MKPCYQDGAQFYDAQTGDLIADYGSLVSNDHDTNGAQAARSTFLSVFGDRYEFSQTETD